VNSNYQKIIAFVQELKNKSIEDKLQSTVFADTEELVALLQTNEETLSKYIDDEKEKW
jgi:hypothetical protein